MYAAPMRAVPLLLVALFAPGCADPAPAPDLAAVEGGGPDLRPGNPYGGDPPGDLATAPARCTGLGAAQGDQHLTLVTRDGRTRVAELHVPQSYDPTIPVPLVLNFHGFLSNPWQQELLSGMKARSEARGFLL